MPGKGELSICALPASWATWEAEKTEDAVSEGRPWPAHAEPVLQQPAQWPADQGMVPEPGGNYQYATF